MEWMLMPLRRYAEFSGRSRRKEYWMFTLLSVIVTVIGYALMLSGGYASIMTAASADPLAPADPAALAGASFGATFWIGAIIVVIWGLGTLIPAIAVNVRRLHDRNMTGWYLAGFIVAVVVLSMIPGIGSILVLVAEIGWIVLMALPGTPGPNQYGPDPLGQADPQVFA